VPISLPNTDRFDGAVDDAFDPLRGNPLADRLFYTASKAAEFSAVWHALSITGAVFVPSLRVHAVRMTVALGIESVLVNAMIKPIFDRQRPDLIEGAPHLRRPKTASFPSGHASSGAMAAVLLTDAVPALRPVWLAAAGVVGASRIHARMHHGSDVAAGFVVGTVLGQIAKAIRPLR
jgi:membrane-associated phospholipid phosphatase